LRAHHATGKNIVNPLFFASERFLSTTICKTYPLCHLARTAALYFVDKKALINNQCQYFS